MISLKYTQKKTNGLITGEFRQLKQINNASKIPVNSVLRIDL